jgi:transposase-like protein
MAGIKVVPYGEGEKRLKPTKEELVNALVERGGSVRATADLYNVQRTQVYRWMRAYAINIEELREG